MSGATSATVDIKYDFTPYDGTPGDMYDKFEERLMNAATRPSALTPYENV